MANRSWVRRKIAESEANAPISMTLADLHHGHLFVYFDGFNDGAGFDKTTFAAQDGTQIFRGERDGRGNNAAFGTIEITTDAVVPVAEDSSGAAGTGTSAAFFMLHQESFIGATFAFITDYSLSLFLIARLSVIEMRLCPGVTSTDLKSLRMVIGAVRVFGARNTLTFFTFIPDPGLSIYEGVYFRLDTDANGAGNWFAVSTRRDPDTAKITTTSKDTGVVPINGFQTFRIEPSTDQVKYFIDTKDNNGKTISNGSVPVATIMTDLPSANAKVGGIGMMMQNITAQAHRASVNTLLVFGKAEVF